MRDPWVIHTGDSLEVLREMQPESIDSIVTDPPYGLGFMGKAWDALPPGEAIAKLMLEVAKPGAHLVAFGGTRTYHRLVVALEDVGWEIRDQLAWVYGSGFPKSLDVSKAIDKAAGAEREVVGSRNAGRAAQGSAFDDDAYVWPGRVDITAPATDAAREWEGWGTALKPAWEPIVLARKPLGQTVAANVLEHGTGALNVDATRIEGKRWPANLLHDGSPEVLAMFPQGRSAGLYPSQSVGTGRGTTYLPTKAQGQLYDDSGSAARFFYTTKASSAERDAGLDDGNHHPTVKPVALMRWLCRLITPPGGLILDPFLGSGSTMVAALQEGFRCVGIERDEQYADIARRRVEEDAPLFNRDPLSPALNT